ncbi:hypothetical protein F5887DRAFT_1081209 [Amanita rubescens]|nr:hypothetical protein F5887DRAFT_1081209 [Amanita rubescens]
MDKLAAFCARLLGEGLLNVPLVLAEGTEAIAMDSDSGGLALDSDNSASESEDGSGSAQESDVHLQLDNSGTDETYIEAILILPGKPVANSGRYANNIAKDISIPRFPDLVKEFLHQQDEDALGTDHDLDSS